MADEPPTTTWVEHSLTYDVIGTRLELVYANNMHLLSSFNRIHKSTDGGHTWASFDSPMNVWATPCLGWDGTRWYGVEFRLFFSSTDGTTWPVPDDAVDMGFTDGDASAVLAKSPARFVATAIDTSGNIVRTSPTGEAGTWTTSLLPFSTNSAVVFWNGSVFCVVAYIATNRVRSAVSPDGLTWTSGYVFPTETGMSNAAYSCAGGKFFICTQDAIWISSNGSIWTKVLRTWQDQGVHKETSTLQIWHNGTHWYYSTRRTANVTTGATAGAYVYISSDLVNWTKMRMGFAQILGQNMRFAGIGPTVVCAGWPTNPIPEIYVVNVRPAFWTGHNSTVEV